MIAIDIGSNTFRVLQMNCQGDVLCDFEKIIRLAQGLHQGKMILPEAKARLMQAFDLLRQRIDLTDERIKAVATAAMRKASNAQEIIDDVQQTFGITIEIIDAPKEAYYARLAVENRLRHLQLQSDDFVLFDIGGGSSEIVFVKHNEVTMKSFDFGIVTIAEASKLSDFATILKQKMRDVQTFVTEYYHTHDKPALLVPTAGTPTTMAAFLQQMDYESYDVTKINGYKLTLKACAKALEGLLNLDEASRKRYVGEGREDLIIAGVKIVMAFYDVLAFSEGVVIDDGVREGVLANMCNEVSHV